MTNAQGRPPPPPASSCGLQTTTPDVSSLLTVGQRPSPPPLSLALIFNSLVGSLPESLFSGFLLSDPFPDWFSTAEALAAFPLVFAADPPIIILGRIFSDRETLGALVLLTIPAFPFHLLRFCSTDPPSAAAIISVASSPHGSSTSTFYSQSEPTRC